MTKTWRQPLYYASGLVVMKAVSFLMLPFVAAQLTNQEYGQLDLWLTAINIGGIVIGFGLVEGLYKFSGSKNKKDLNILISTTTLLQAKVALVFLFAGSIGFCFSFFYVERTLWLYGLLTFGTVTISALINIPLSWLRLIDNAFVFFICTSSKAIIQALLTWFFLVLDMGLMGVLLSSLLSSVYLAVLLFIVQNQKVHWVYNSKETMGLLKYGLPIVGSTLLLFISLGAERWILAFSIGLDKLAIYAIAMQFALMISVFCEPITLWWYPKRFQLLNANQGKLITACISEGIVHFCLWMSLASAILAPFVITFFFPERYHQVIELLPWLALGMSFKQASHTCNIGCYQQTLPKTVFYINAVTALVAVIAFSVLSWFFSLYGAIFAFILTFFIRMILFFVVSQKILYIPYRVKILIAHLLLLVSVLFYFQSSIVFIVFCWIVQTVFLFFWLKKIYSLYFSNITNPMKNIAYE